MWRWYGSCSFSLARSKLAQLRLAQQEIAAANSPPPIGGSPRWRPGPGLQEVAADYWLGVCEALGGRPDAALRAFARLPEDFAFDAVGAYLEAKSNLSQGRLHAAERRLEKTLARGGPALDQVRDLLNEIYQIEVRFDDDKSMLLASLADANEPILVLKDRATSSLIGFPMTACRPCWSTPASWRRRKTASGLATPGWRSRPAAGTKRETG